MGVVERHDAKNILEGSRVALQTHIPVHTMGQKRCFWIPGMGVFEFPGFGTISSRTPLFPPKRPKSIQSGVSAYFWGGLKRGGSGQTPAAFKISLSAAPWYARCG